MKNTTIQFVKMVKYIPHKWVRAQSEIFAAVHIVVPTLAKNQWRRDI